MKKLTTSIVALVALLAFAVPASAQQITTMGPTCWACDQGSCAWEDWHEDSSTGNLDWNGGFNHGSICRQWTCSQDHNSGCGALASAEDVMENERMNEILNTMEGDARVLALVAEFPDKTHLTPGGDAIEVLGEGCDGSRLIGRLQVTMRQAVAVIDAKSSYLASN